MIGKPMVQLDEGEAEGNPKSDWGNDATISVRSATIAALEIGFRNTSDRTLKTTVALPVPNVSALPYIDISIPNDDPADLLGFETRVEGKPITMTLG